MINFDTNTKPSLRQSRYILRASMPYSRPPYEIRITRVSGHNSEVLDQVLPYRHILRHTMIASTLCMGNYYVPNIYLTIIPRARMGY